MATAEVLTKMLQTLLGSWISVEYMKKEIEKLKQNFADKNAMSALKT